MLTDQEKQHIFEEELYRREVKTRLETAKPKGDNWQKYWSFVNSGVFIWFLSSIVLGSATFLYTRWEKEYVTERENRRAANRLDAEITNRLVYFNNLLTMRKIALEERSKIGESQSIDAYDLSKLVIALERPSAADYPTNVFPEYANRNLRSLLWELMQIVSHHERETIRPAYERSLQLQIIYLKDLYGSKHSPTGRMISAFQARALTESNIVVRDFYSTFNLPRWGSVFAEQLQKHGEEKSGGKVPGK